MVYQDQNPEFADDSPTEADAGPARSSSRPILILLIVGFLAAVLLAVFGQG